VRDIARIVVMVAGRLLTRGMYPSGLWRSLTIPAALEGMPELTGLPSVSFTDEVNQKVTSPPHSAGN
jgi:hypothetical protein